MIEVEGDMMTGFELFGKAHLIWLTISVICIALIYVLNRRVDERARLRLSWGLAWLTLLSHLAESGFRIHEGSYSIYTLPLHICALTSYLVFIHRIRPRRPLGEILFCPGIAGALAALLAPDWTYYPPFSFMSAIGFIAHIAIILYILQAIWSRSITPSIKRAFIPVRFLAVYALVMIPFDRHFNVNYGFLNDPSPGSILVPLAERFGYGLGYYVGYALLVLAGILISYALYALLTIHRRPSAS